jgi:fructokinase
MNQQLLCGGIEGGGTKFVCAVGTAPDNIINEVRFPTTTPAETLARAGEFFEPYIRQGSLAAIGIGSFGPVDLEPSSPTYGTITTTPKPGWSNTDMVSSLYRSLGVPIIFELDVNAAAFGEYYWNPENRARNPLVYFTIGTGIGAGIVVDGRLVHGLLHPEAGHVLIPHDWQRDPYAGGCPYHGDCFEGLASGPAMQQRWGQPAETLPADHPAWDLEATYVALAMSNIIYTLSPKRIVLGGGVMQHEGLFPKVWDRVCQYLNGYIRSPGILERIDDTIVPPSLGHRSGILGAIALARLAVEGK